MKNNYKLWFILSLIVVFVLGILGGVLLDKYALQSSSKKIRRERRSVHFPTLELMSQELRLSAEQKSKIKDIFKNNEENFKALRSLIHERLSSIRSQLITDIKNVLNEEQKVKFEAMITRYLEQRQKEMEKRKTKSKNRGGDK
ncbi:MAG: hypothetical protein ACE5GI_01710 [Candidatus Aminicenantales bacterium]